MFGLDDVQMALVAAEMLRDEPHHLPGDVLETARFRKDASEVGQELQVSGGGWLHVAGPGFLGCAAEAAPAGLRNLGAEDLDRFGGDMGRELSAGGEVALFVEAGEESRRP